MISLTVSQMHVWRDADDGQIHVGFFFKESKDFFIDWTLGEWEERKASLTNIISKTMTTLCTPAELKSYAMPKTEPSTN